MKRITKTCLIATTVLCLLLSGCQIHMSWGSKAQERHTRTVELQTALAPGSHLEVRTAAGSIQVQGTDVDVCKVVVTIKTRGETEEEAIATAEKVVIRFEQDKKGVRIVADTPRFSKGLGISYHVTVPRDTSVTCGAASGRIQLEGLNGTFVARTASGSITCDEISGESAKLQAASGSITCAEIDCTRIKAVTASGSVTISCTSSATKELHADLSAGSGSVSLSMPQGFAGHMELSAGSGSVHTDFPVTVKGTLKKKHLSGTVGEGSGDLRLKTASGSVRVHK